MNQWNLINSPATIALVETLRLVTSTATTEL